MGQQYPYYTIWENNIVVIIHIDGTRVMFLLFFIHQNTESKLWEVEIGSARPIFTPQKPQSLYGTTIFIL